MDLLLHDNFELPNFNMSCTLFETLPCVLSDIVGAFLAPASELPTEEIQKIIDDAKQSNQNLSGLDWTGIDFSLLNLEGADLWDVNFTGTKLYGAKINNAETWRSKEFIEALSRGQTLPP